MAKSKLAEKWEAARNDLGLDIVIPYQVDFGNNFQVQAKLLVRNFGARKGTLIFTDMDLVWPHRNELSNLGYGYCVLDEPTDKTNEVYDRDLFIDMLSEWEWTGDEATRPTWLRPPPNEE